MKMPTVTPSADWPIGRRVVLLDAYLRNPIEVKVTKHPNPDHLITEDDRGVVHYTANVVTGEFTAHSGRWMTSPSYVEDQRTMLFQSRQTTVAPPIPNSAIERKFGPA